ncbi:MAG: mandelate racemase/muconate lactonizing enzyme family protein [bacterium]
MKFEREKRMNRRTLLRHGAAAASFTLAWPFLEKNADAQAPSSSEVNKNSAPSQLKITDMRACTVASNYDYPIIRIDTNQGISGLGEVRDAGIKGLALVLKPHLVGRNPLQIEPILDRIRRFAGHYRFGGGYSAIDMALHDIAGKVYGVPVWRLLGSKYRDKVRIYCDTPGSKDPAVFAERLKRRKAMGFTFFKMDLGTHLVADQSQAVNDNGSATEKGLKLLCEYVAAVREGIGYDAPLAADHFGRLSVNDCIRYARAFEPYQLAWAEDFIPFQDWRGYQTISEATTTPILTGEDAFGLEEGFRDLIENHAVDIIHPDPETAGGIRETKRIADYAAIHGIPTAIHFAGSPVGCMASVHAIATIKNFIAMENHAVDIPWWSDLVTGIAKPIVNNGYIEVPEAPGLGVELNEEVVKEHLREPGYFEPTPEYDHYILDDFRIRGPYPHLDEYGNPVNQ